MRLMSPVRIASYSSSSRLRIRSFAALALALRSGGTRGRRLRACACFILGVGRPFPTVLAGDSSSIGSWALSFLKGFHVIIRQNTATLDAGKPGEPVTMAADMTICSRPGRFVPAGWMMTNATVRSIMTAVFSDELRARVEADFGRVVDLLGRKSR